MIGTKIRTSYSVTMVLHSPAYVRLSARIGKNEFTKLTPNKNRKNVLKYQSHSPCLFINNQIPSLFYLCLFCKKFFCIFLNICYLFCSQIHKIAVIHRAIRILYIHHLSIFLSNRIEPYFLWYIVNFTLLH